VERDTVILYQPRVDYKPYYPCFWAPLSILSVAAPLVAKDIKVILLDGNLERHQQDKRIVEGNVSKCICIGISSMIGGNQLKRALNFAIFAKNQRSDLPIVFGGPSATTISKDLLTESVVDFVIRLQGEQPFSDLVDSLINNRNVSSIPGVITREHGKDIKPVFLDKNIFPVYPWHLLDIEEYIRSNRYLGQRVLNYISSQGCPYKCGYCSETASYNCHWKAFSAQRTLSEIQELQVNYQLDGIKFYDSNFFVNPKRVIEFAQGLLNSKSRLKWGASAHPRDVIRLQGNLAEIRESGLSRLLIGAESGSQIALDYINKGCSVEDNLTVARLCAKHSIATVFTFIVGVPGISKDIKETLDMVLEMKKISGEFDIKIHFYAPFPGTSLFEEAKKFGYRPPISLQEWSGYDYYLIQTPWIGKNQEIKVRQFGDFYCDFLYPPTWFKKLLRSKPISSFTYKVLRKLIELRCKIHFYGLPIERNWFKQLTGREIFKK
jgi:radical SAM superfamily enzyme YgiQ (UPF0313 family)